MSGTRTPAPRTPVPATPVLQAGLFQGMVPEIFANQIRLGAAISDFALVFGVTGISFAGIAPPRDQVIVRLAPTTLKQLSLNLQMAVEAYQEAVGDIIMPARTSDHIAALKNTLVASLQAQMTAPPIAL